MADEKIEGVGAPLAADVAAQISIRKASIGKLSNRSDQDLLYQNGNTAWIRLSSSVNTLTQTEIDSLTKQEGRTTVTGDSRLSGYNILQGGVLAPDRSLRQGIEFTSTDNQYAAYNNRTRSTGFRPMPGITSLSVQSKNTYGTLREADVKFSVWSLEDFETMEQIYLRPGFTMLLEWGHSVYYGNDGQLVTNVKTIPNTFFQTGIKMSTILALIARIRKESSYNYEAMIGYCKNFSWSYKANGEYECSVSIISTGEILESLTAKIDPQLKGVPKAEMVQDDTEKAKDLKKSPIHYFVSKLEKIKETPWNKDHFVAQAPTMGKKLQPFTGYYLDVEYKAAGSFWSDDTPTHWIPLSTFFDICTKYLSTVDNTKPENSPDRYYVVFNTDRTKSSKFLTHPNHFSADPTICVLPKKSRTGLGEIPAIHTYTEATPPEGGFDNVLNILVSTIYLKKVFNDALDDMQGFKKPLAELIEEILSAINTSLGGINDLALSYDEEAGRGTFYLVDRNNTNYPAVTELSLAGSDSIFTEINISSKISNEMASQIAIAAQGSLQDQHDNVENILKWNPGIIDRIHVTKDVSVTSSNNLEELRQKTIERTTEWEKDVRLFFQLFNNTTVGWKDAQLQAAKTLHAERNVQWLKDAVVTSKIPMPGIIPVELSFKLDGLGGLKIGNCFKIAAGILPSKYQGKFGYIITGLEQSIGSNNRWETSVKALFYSIDATSATAALNANVNSLDENIKRSNKGSLRPEDFGIIQVTSEPPAALITAMKAYGITLPLERAHFLSQCAHESLNFKVTTECASGAGYEDREDLGNTQKGDGKKYKGRGYIQVTGRSNYTSYNRYLLRKGIKDDILKNPNLVATKFAADSACWWWKFVNPGLPKISLGGATPVVVEQVTRIINGGTTGLLDRQGKFNGYWATLQKNPQAYT